ncbi:E3 Ubiquitin-Protein Ligase Arkadia [Manis pentadactyla]|nr:E3 Ubiquitin-Protein Ligase Arkadia [Manis pentadactyla]
MQRFRPNPAEVVDLTADDDDDVDKQMPFTSFFLLFLAHTDEIEEASSTPQVTAYAEIVVTLTDSDHAETDVTLSDSEVETVTDGESQQSPSTPGHSRYPWSESPSPHTHRPQEPSTRSRASTATQRFRPNPAEVVDLTADDDDDEPTVVPLTSSRMESPTTSPWIHNYSESSALEQASDSESTDDSSETSTASETSAPRTRNRMTGTSIGGAWDLKPEGLQLLRHLEHRVPTWTITIYHLDFTSYLYEFFLYW